MKLVCFFILVYSHVSYIRNEEDEDYSTEPPFNKIHATSPVDEANLTNLISSEINKDKQSQSRLLALFFLNPLYEYKNKYGLFLDHKCIVLTLAFHNYNCTMHYKWLKQN